MKVILEYYVVTYNNTVVLLGSVFCDKHVAEDPAKRIELGRAIGIDGWNFVICGALNKRWFEGNGYSKDVIYYFHKDDDGKLLSLQFVPGFDLLLSAVAPKIRGYNYFIPVIDETPLSNEDMLGGYDSSSYVRNTLNKKTKKELCEILKDKCDLNDLKSVMIDKIIELGYAE